MENLEALSMTGQVSGSYGGIFFGAQIWPMLNPSVERWAVRFPHQAQACLSSVWAVLRKQGNMKESQGNNRWYVDW